MTLDDYDASNNNNGDLIGCRNNNNEQTYRPSVNIRHRGTLRTPLALPDNNTKPKKEGLRKHDHEDKNQNKHILSSLALSSSSSDTVSSTLIGCCVAACFMYPIEDYHTKWQTHALHEWTTNDYRPRQNHPYRKLLSPISRLFFQEIALNITDSLTRQQQQHHYRNASSSSNYYHHYLLSTPLRQEITAGTLSGIAQALLLCPLAARQVTELEQISLKRRFKKQWSYLWNGGCPTDEITTNSSKNRITSSSTKNGNAITANTMTFITNPKERIKRAYRGITLLAIREVLYNVSFFPLAYIMKQQKSAWLFEYEKNLQLHRIMNHHHHQQQDDDYNNNDNDKDFNKFFNINSNNNEKNHPIHQKNSTFSYFDSIAIRYFALENLIVWRSNICAGMICSLLVVPIDIARTYYWYSYDER